MIRDLGLRLWQGGGPLLRIALRIAWIVFAGTLIYALARPGAPAVVYAGF